MFHSSGDATTTICHRYTPPDQLSVFTKIADIIVSATGIPKLITGDMIKEGATVIDVGINRIKDEETGKTKLVGDVDFEGEFQKYNVGIGRVRKGCDSLTLATKCCSITCSYMCVYGCTCLLSTLYI